MKLPGNAFDWFVFAGAATNVAVIAIIVGYWLTH